MEFPSSGERAEARCGGNLYSCATRERRITRPYCDADPCADASVPNVGLVRREAAAAALHPYARPNSTTGERLTEPNRDSDSNADANRSHAASESIREHCSGPITRNDPGLAGRAS